MKRTNHLGPRVVVLTILFFLSMAAVSAQSLDGKWFVLSCQVQSLLVDPITGHFVPYNFGFKAYVNFSYTGPGDAPRGSVYICDVWSQDSPGHWMLSSSDLHYTSPISENFFPDWNINFYTKDGVSVWTFVTPHVSVFPNVFKAGGEIYRGENSQGKSIYGWLTISGELATSLPFTVN